MESGMLETRLGPVAWQSSGRGPSLVFFAGALANHDLWRDVIAQMEELRSAFERLATKWIGKIKPGMFEEDSRAGAFGLQAEADSGVFDRAAGGPEAECI